MEPKTGRTHETESILSLPPRAMAVWLLGKLSVLLAVILLALPALFALELMAEARRAERDRLMGFTETPSPPPTTGVLQDRSPLAAIRLAPGSTPAPLPTAALSSAATPSADPTTSSTSPASAASLAPWRPATNDTPTATSTGIPRSFAVVAEQVRPTITASLPFEPSPTDAPDSDFRPVQIRIPAIKVKRSIVQLPQIRDPQSGAWTHDLDILFSRSRKDLVGHYEQSASPGQEGNIILVGHNYGRGYKGVFLRLGRLKPGKEIYVVSAAGKTFTYRVTAIEKVPWRRRNTEELLRHAKLLAESGPERLTLVTCGGANVQPFPIRIYVIAEPVRD